MNEKTWGIILNIMIITIIFINFAAIFKYAQGIDNNQSRSAFECGNDSEMAELGMTNRHCDPASIRPQQNNMSEILDNFANEREEYN